MAGEIAGIAGAAGGLAAATPYGAAIGAAGQVLSSALTDKPSNTTSGSGSYQSGPFVIGSKQVGGKGNSAGATTASASQTPAGSADANSATAQNKTMLYLTIGGVAIALLALVLNFMGHKRSHSEK
jgi:hypothetical protein